MRAAARLAQTAALLAGRPASVHALMMHSIGSAAVPARAHAASSGRVAAASTRLLSRGFSQQHRPSTPPGSASAAHASPSALHQWSLSPPSSGCSPAMLAAAASTPPGYVWPSSLSAQPVLLYEARILDTSRRLGTTMLVILPFITGIAAYALWERSQFSDSETVGVPSSLPSPAAAAAAPAPRKRVFHPQVARSLLAVNVAFAAVCAGMLLFNRRLVRSIRFFPRARVVAVRTLHTLPDWRILGGAPREVLLPLEALAPPLVDAPSNAMLVRMQVAAAPRIDSVSQWERPVARPGTKAAAVAAVTDIRDSVTGFDDAWSAVVAELASEPGVPAELIGGTAASGAPLSRVASLSMRPAQTFYLMPSPNDALNFSSTLATVEPVLEATWNRVLSTGLHPAADVEQLARAFSKLTKTT